MAAGKVRQYLYMYSGMIKKFARPTVTRVQAVITCCIAHGVITMMNVSEMAAEVREVRLHLRRCSTNFSAIAAADWPASIGSVVKMARRYFWLAPVAWKIVP